MNHSIDARALDLMLRAGSRWVLWLLICLSVAAVAVAIERLWFFARARRQRGRVEAALAALRRAGPVEAQKALGTARSLESTVAQVCFAHLSEGAEAVQEYVTAAIDTDRVHYERGLAFLGTLGSNAPFIGLFGTVLGIVRAFHDLATSVALGSQAVMAGIAEALVATAIGLLVALPAVAAYNILMRHVETAVVAANAVSHQILAHIKAQPATLPPAPKAQPAKGQPTSETRPAGGQ
ncbi:MAG: MotA/TolQ/ExbB proton channel family protein [Polyangia bacterium]|jgi:biopolymer transport protein ExbB